MIGWPFMPYPGYRQRIKEIHQELGICDDYEELYGLPLQYEAEQLIDAGYDMFGRNQLMAPVALKHWAELRDAALEDNVQLLLVSAFRSVDYQATIIERKLEQGMAIETILKASAAPGYSEHHTGCAVDLTTIDCPPLIESFETTRAFRWLCLNAERFGFAMSYPKINKNKIIYEPWHWKLKENA
jgi:D-alanyl-D-alanine carboxypeptidase